MNNATKEQLIAFTDKLKEFWENGDLPYMMHFSGGNEDQLINIFKEINEGDYIFSNHRSHYHYLLAGGDPQQLMWKIGAGDSMFIYDKKLNFLTSSILGGTPAIAAGVAMALKKKGSDKKVWCFVGDAGCENGHFYEAVRLVWGKDLPCTFIIEDNDRSITVPSSARYGLEAWDYPSCVKRYSYFPTYPHVGSGCKHKIEFKCK